MGIRRPSTRYAVEWDDRTHTWKLRDVILKLWVVNESFTSVTPAVNRADELNHAWRRYHTPQADVEFR